MSEAAPSALERAQFQASNGRNRGPWGSCLVSKPTRTTRTTLWVGPGPTKWDEFKKRAAGTYDSKAGQKLPARPGPTRRRSTASCCAAQDDAGNRLADVELMGVRTKPLPSSGTWIPTRSDLSPHRRLLANWWIDGRGCVARVLASARQVRGLGSKLLHSWRSTARRGRPDPLWKRRRPPPRYNRGRRRQSYISEMTTGTATGNASGARAGDDAIDVRELHRIARPRRDAAPHVFQTRRRASVSLPARCPGLLTGHVQRHLPARLAAHDAQRFHVQRAAVSIAAFSKTV